ncbi:KH domain-containing protein [Alicyclobacillus tolerans]|uniref:KH domain-containing protein n=1 Tax=Alicyclobacillus tolerans TaxID=90970 RepID=UPI001F28F7A5|nr:KH domain-containing protein [Alicyclobacillus tolerans]MCF8564388.1 KH domain-containing protein [Alicyclobacillus tolerans]
MKELVEFLAKSLVNHPDSVHVTEDFRGETIVYHIQVDPSDVGKVIGRQGRIAKSIRNVVSATAYRQNKHVVVEIS